MKKNKIKIIKRNDAGEKVIAEAPVAEKTDEEIRKRHGNIVQDWIAERRENSRLERIFTDRHIVAWKELPYG